MKVNFFLVEITLAFVWCTSHVHAQNGCESITIPVITKEFVTTDTSGVEFIDIEGYLSDIIEEPLEIEFLSRDLGFVEGPKWIKDDSYVSGGYLLFTETTNGVIWKYDDDLEELECVSTNYEGEGPNAIGWHENFPNELWIVLFITDAIVRVDINSFEELNRFTSLSNGNVIQSPNDIVIDAKGNGYFSNFPAYVDSFSGDRGVFKIERTVISDSESEDNDDNNESTQFEVTLIEYLNYGTQGIDITQDGKLLLVTNTIDFEIGIYDIFNISQVNYDNIFLRGYYLDPSHSSDSSDSSSQDSNNNDNKNNNNDLVGFDYHVFNSELDKEYIDASHILDSSGFDPMNNYWQSFQTVPGGADGGAIIVKEDKLIGMIKFGDDLGATNFEYDSDNGYMYGTIVQTLSNVGSLVRIKLKNIDTDSKEANSKSSSQ